MILSDNYNLFKCQKMFDKYLIDNYRDDIINILRDEDIEKHFSIIINFGKLFENCAELCNNLLEKPRKTLRKLNQESLKAQKVLLEEDLQYTEKRNVHVRISGLPACPELHRTIFPTNNDLGAFLQISGTVVRMTASKMLEYQRNYRCTKCKHISTIKADYEQHFVFHPPKFCTKNDCNNKNLMQINELAPGNCKDYQEVRLQEQVSKLSIGTIPTSMWVTLEDDLVDGCKPGDDITVCGVVMRRWKPVANKKLDVELVLRANYVEVNNDQRSIRLITPEVRTHFNDFWEVYKNRPLIGRDIILRSICPELYGLYIVKLAVAVILAGGSQRERTEATEMKIRSEPHLLLVGDPGLGKSQILRFASKVIPRSVLTTGIGCTSAGLTVAAVMEEGEWHLEAGALVLSDEGICCIDEFNSMKEHDKTSIHEAMEQQTISVAKASMVCKLNTRCSVLAATNNKDKSSDIAMSSPLLSRFDLVLFLRDSFNPKWDEVVCDYLLNNQINETDKNDKQFWTIELIQAYFTVIKGFHPTLTDESNSVLRAYYQAQRQAPERNKARTTVRLLDSLVRLSQAHARLMFHTEVLVMDAVMAVALIESSMQGAALLLPVTIDTLHAPFPLDPIRTYKELMSNILQKLKLYAIFNNELAKIQHDSIQHGYEINTDNGTESHIDFNDTNSIDDTTENNNDCNESRFDSDYKINENVTIVGDRNENITPKKIVRERNENITPKKIVRERNENITPKKIVGERNENITPNKNNITSNKIKKDNKKNNRNEIFSKNITPIKNKNLNSNDVDEFCKPDNKRKRSENKMVKKSKKVKNTVLNDAELINLVPSVNDVFELDEMDLSLEPNFTPYEQPITQEKIENFNKNVNDLKNKFVFKNDKHLCRNTKENSHYSNRNENISDKSNRNENISDKLNRNENISDISNRNKNISDKSNRNENISDKSNRNENISDKSNCNENIPNKSNRNENISDKSNRNENIPNKSNRNENISDKSNRNENISDKSNRNENIFDKSNRNENRVLDVSSITKTIRNNSNLKNNESFNSSLELNFSVNSNESFNTSDNDIKGGSKSIGFLKQFAFKKTPKKDVETSPNISTESNELFISSRSYENSVTPSKSNRTVSRSYEALSKSNENISYSQLTSNTLFQSQDDCLDDLHFDL